MNREGQSLLSGCPSVPRRLLTVDEYGRMREAGIITEDERVELIEGQLIAMAPINSAHEVATNALIRVLVLGMDTRAIVAVGNRVRLTAYDEVQPDFSVLKPRDNYYENMARPEDTWLVVEVASASLDYDREVKLRLYARAGIPEVWIVNVAAVEVEVHRSPVADSYTSVARLGRSDRLTIAALPGLLFPVAKIFA